MKSKLNYRFVTGMHGNEYMPVLALASLGVAQIVANPEALKMCKRFKDEDINSIFTVSRNSYESRRAKELLKIIKKTETVIDFHTSNSANVPFCIVTKEEMLPLTKKTGISRVVVMKLNIKHGKALIDQRKGISIEVGKHSAGESFTTTRQVYKNLTQKRSFSRKIKVYETYGYIRKAGKYVNFKKFTDGDESFYPIFTGESSYSFVGLKTRFIGSI